MLAVGGRRAVAPVVAVVLRPPLAALGRIVGGAEASFAAAALGRVVVVVVVIVVAGVRVGPLARRAGPVGRLDREGGAVRRRPAEGVRVRVAVLGVAVLFVLVFAGQRPARLRVAVALRRHFDSHLELVARGDAVLDEGRRQPRLFGAAFVPAAVAAAVRRLGALLVVVRGDDGRRRVRVHLVLRAVLRGRVARRRVLLPVLFQSQDLLRPREGGGRVRGKLLAFAAGSAARRFGFVFRQREVREVGEVVVAAALGLVAQRLVGRDAAEGGHVRGVRRGGGEEGVGHAGEAV